MPDEDAQHYLLTLRSGREAVGILSKIPDMEKSRSLDELGVSITKVQHKAAFTMGVIGIRPIVVRAAAGSGVIAVHHQECLRGPGS